MIQPKGRPGADECAPFYARYVALVPGDDVVEALAEQGERIRRVLGGVPAGREEHRYAEGKWSVREVVGHVTDAERVLAYRALSFARGSVAALPSFDENAWVPASGHAGLPLPELAAELLTVRASTLHLFRQLPTEAWSRRGTASDKAVTVRALAWIVAGHAAHHLGLLGERYGLTEAP